MAENNEDNSFVDFRNTLNEDSSNDHGDKTASINETESKSKALSAKQSPVKFYSNATKVRIKAGITTIVVLAGILIYIISNSGAKAEIKAPEGYKIVEPVNAPPRLEKIN